MARDLQQHLSAGADDGEAVLDHVHIVRRDRALAPIAAKVASDADAVVLDEMACVHFHFDGGHDGFLWREWRRALARDAVCAT
jgi:hypothetical protein